MRDDELSHPYLLKHLNPGEAHTPIHGDVESWLVRLEVGTPLDEERIRDLERWRGASDVEHAEAFVSLLSVVDAMEHSLLPKQPLLVRFPRRFAGAKGRANKPV